MFQKEVEKKGSFEIIQSKGINAEFFNNREEFMSGFDKGDDGTTSDWDLDFEDDDEEEVKETTPTGSFGKGTPKEEEMIEGTKPPVPVTVSSRRKRSGSGNFLIPDA